MPTPFHLWPTGVVRRLRTQGDRWQRAIMAQRPAVRWGLVTLIVALAVGISTGGYWALSSLSTVGIRHLLAGKRLSSDDLIKVCRALDRQRVGYRIDDERRVQVTTDQFDQAAEIVAKLDLGQHSIDEIREQSSSAGGLFDWPNEREQKKHLAGEKILERLINQLDGVTWSLVSINRPHASGWLRSAAKSSAFVYIETERNHYLPYQTIQAIPMLVAGYEHDLTPASITVMDRRGITYFDAGSVAVGDHSRNRAREEELAARIVEALSWIKGVRVQVHVLPSRAPEPAATASRGQRPSADTASPKPEHAKVSSASGGTNSLIGLNRPLTLELKPTADPPAERSIGSANDSGSRPSGIAVSTATAGTSALPRNDQRHEHGRVLIYVPRSFYYNIDIRNPDREPARDELLVMRDRTERQIRTAVGWVVPETDSWKVDVDIIPDDVTQTRLAVLPSADDPRRRILDWGVVGTVGAAVSILAAIGSWIHVARRPSVVAEPGLKSRRYDFHSMSEHGPSERVRELIRRNPEAAASVLKRWAGGGGEAS